MRAFRELIELIENGDPVDAATINRILQELHSNTQYVRDLLEAAAMGEAIYIRRAPTSTDLLVGQAAYLHAEAQEWQPGLAVSDVVAGNLQLAASAQVWGVVASKYDDRLADILLLGFAELDMSAAITETIVPGQYYLSATLAGQLTRDKPALPIPVLQLAGEGETEGTRQVFVKPGTVNAFSNHEHLKFDLQTVPAGTADLADGVWTIPSPNDEIEGWLPADHAVFAGNAPEGAKFGYNLSASALRNYWPIPAANAYLEWDQGLSGLLGQGVPTATDGLALIDTHGIWWLSDCEGEVPWEAEEEATTTTTPEPPP